MNDNLIKDSETETKETVELTPEQEFDSAWDEEDENQTEDSENLEEDSDDQPETEEDSLDTEGSDEEAVTPEDTNQESATDTEDTEDSPLNTTELQSQIDHLTRENQAMEQRMKSWEGRIKSANTRAKAAEKKLKQAQAKQDKASKDDLPDDFDDAVLSDFIDEFPSLEKPIRALVKKVVNQAVTAKVDGDLGEVKAKVETIEKSKAEADTQAHTARILEAHPDWETIYESGDLTKWINDQPTYVQTALNQVIESGTTEAIIEMFDQFKAAQALDEDQTTPTSQSQSTGRSKSKRAADMQAVPAKTGGPPKQPPKKDQQDYDSAWDEAISEK